MGNTRQIPRDEWQDYFERLTRQRLRDERAPESCTVELLSPTRGDQLEASSARLEGLSYDPRANSLEVQLGEGLDNLVFYPRDIWTIEEEDGFVSTLQITRDEGAVEILYIHRSGPLAPAWELPSPGS